MDFATRKWLASIPASPSLQGMPGCLRRVPHLLASLRSDGVRHHRISCPPWTERAAYLPGLAMRRIADLHAGEAKTDAPDAAIIVEAARSMPHALRTLRIADDALVELMHAA